MRIKLTIAYDGTPFCGWQVQPNGVSIQTLLQKALETILRHPITLSGAGRTDAGVHALGQTAHFDTDKEIDLHRLRLSCNALLPEEIRILAAERAADDFHARYSAIGKIYHYQLAFCKGPLSHRYRTPVYGRFNLAALLQAAAHFVGTHDFLSFANHSPGSTSTYDSIRTLRRLDAIVEPGGLRLEFEGEGFLYKMVRNITGTLLEVASGKRSPETISSLLQGKNRRLSGHAAPAQGLILIKVLYPD